MIAYVSKNKESDLLVYISYRLSRLFSVVWPALLVTLISDQIGLHYFPEFYHDAWWFKDSWPVIRLGLSIFLLNQVWFHEFLPFSNGPFWSLGYELWFYVLFIPIGFAIKRRKLVFILICALAGPRVLILFPSWLLGVYLYKHVNKYVLSIRTSIIILILSFAAYSIYRYYLGQFGFTQLVFNNLEVFNLSRSSGFLDIYFVSLMIFFHLMAVYNLLRNLKDSSMPKSFYSMNRIIASGTFAIYAVHFPIVFCIAAIYKLAVDTTIPIDYTISMQLIIIPLVVAIGVTMIGNYIRKPIALAVYKILNLIKSSYFTKTKTVLVKK